MVDCGFEPRSHQTKDYEIGICCFSTKHVALRRKSKDWLAQNQNNVSRWSVMSTSGLLFQWACTIKIQLSMLVQDKAYIFSPIQIVTEFICCFIYQHLCEWMVTFLSSLKLEGWKCWGSYNIIFCHQMIFNIHEVTACPVPFSDLNLSTAQHFRSPRQIFTSLWNNWRFPIKMRRM